MGVNDQKFKLGEAFVRHLEGINNLPKIKATVSHLQFFLKLQ